MKVVLIQPPIQDFYETDIRLQPIGLAYIKAAVKKHLPHVDVVIHDFHQGWSRRTVAVPSELKYLKPPNNKIIKSTTPPKARSDVVKLPNTNSMSVIVAGGILYKV